MAIYSSQSVTGRFKRVMFSWLQQGVLLCAFLAVSSASYAASYIYTLEATPDTIAPGEKSTLTWSWWYSGCPLYLMPGYQKVTDLWGTSGTYELSPPNLGENKYEMWCNGGADLAKFTIVVGEVGAIHAPAITSFEVRTAPFQVGRQARLVATFPHNQQTCSVSGDHTITARTPTASFSPYSIEGNNFTWQEAREHSFTLTCTNESGEPDATMTITQMVDPKPPEPLIEISSASFTQSSGAHYSDFYAPNSKSLAIVGSNIKSGVQCSVDIEYPDSEIKTLTGSATIAITNSNMAGIYNATNVFCTNLDGVPSNVVDASAAMNVQAGPPKILSFTIDDDNIETSQSSTLRWESEHTASCDITDVESGEKTTELPANGSFEFAARPRIGQYSYDLTCFSSVSFQGNPLNTNTGWPTALPLRLTISVSAEPYQHGMVSGQYLGEYHLFMSMRTADTSGAMTHVSMAGNMCTLGENGELCPEPEPWTPAPFSHVDEYKVIGRMSGMLGKNIDPSYWMWDFDKGEIWLGSSTVVALESSYVPFRLYDPSKVKDIRQTTPEDRPDLWQMIGTFEPSGEQAHVYHVKFNMQFFMAMAGYPLAKLELRMGIANNGDDTLYIGTMKGHPADKDTLHYFNAHNVYNNTTGQRETAAYHDYLLGAVLPGSGDMGNADRTLPAYNAFAPFRVSPLFGSTRMSKVNKTEICANGLSATFYREFLRISGDKNTVCGAIPVVNGEMDSDADGYSDIDEIAGRAASESERQGVLDGGYVMPIKRDTLYDFMQPEAFWRKPWFAGLIALGNGEKAVLYTRHHEEEADALVLGDYRKAIPGIVWEPVPKVFFGEADHLYLPTPATARLPISEVWNIGSTVCTSKHLYELGSIRLPSVVNDASRAGWFYLYFNKGIPDGLTLYELAGPRLWSSNYLGQDKWNIDQFRIAWERLEDEEDPGYATTVRFKIPTSSVYGPMTAQIAIGHHIDNFCPQTETQPRTDVAFDAEEPGYVALVQKAEGWTYTPPDTASVWLFGVNRNDQYEVTITPGSSVTFHWNVNYTHQCRIAKADWSELDGAETIVWGNAADSWTTPAFDKTGVYTFQLVCDPGFAIGEEPELVTVRVVKEGDSEDLPPPTQGAGTKPEAGSFGFVILMVMFAAVMRRRGVC